MITYRPPQSTAFRVEEYTQLTEDRLQFDGPRATYGRFRVLHQIGAGSVGPVFRGEDGETRRPVVIKVIRVGLTPERVAIVGAALATLRERLPAHPALAPLIDAGVVDVEPYIVSPFVDGDSLDVALREFGPANMNDALPRLRQLADAMDTAAAAGTAHGSLHLRDIVVSVDETVLTGMGIASVLERVGVRPPVRRPYCAPEVALGHGISPAADQYALAAIAHEWLSGRRLSGSGAAGFQVPAVTEDGADALRDVFARAMDEHPDRRYPTVTAFVDAIAANAGHAASRSKSGRRAPVVAPPRLAFDDDPDDSGDALAAADGPGEDLHAAESHPLDAPLHPAGVAGMTGAASWDSAPAHEDPLDVFTDQGAPMSMGAAAPPSDDDSGVTDAPEDAGDDPHHVEGASWTTWAAMLAGLTVTALVGGWMLLRWSTPRPTVATTAQTAPASATPAASPSPEPPAAVPAPKVAPEPPATEAPVPTPAPAPPVTAPSPLAEPGRPVPQAPPPARQPPARQTPARDAAQTRAPRKVVPPVERPAVPSAPSGATDSGRVLVRSTPGGAEVFVNGERRGVTPLALRDLAFGAYLVRVVRPGFVPVEQRVAIDAGRPARSLELSLVRAGTGVAAPAPAGPEATAPGSLLVESRPSGARVIVDGADAGVTPVTLPTLAAGSHTIRIEHPGYVTISTTARVEARIRARVAVTLTAERPR